RRFNEQEKRSLDRQASEVTDTAMGRRRQMSLHKPSMKLDEETFWGRLEPGVQPRPSWLKPGQRLTRAPAWLNGYGAYTIRRTGKSKRLQERLGPGSFQQYPPS
ncbi:MAG TPA: hypothetical protein VFV34_04020, partial [Blastocatellia bacterium]|nr:hypothetical protein [Blastocatellia bacterium]